MKYYTDLQYVQIALANAAGFEKTISSNENKILWAEMADLADWKAKAKDKMAYADAYQAYQDAHAGIPSGFIMGMDAGASGVQMLSVLTGDLKAAISTGLAKEHERGNFYKDVEKAVDSGLDIDPDDLKQAVMTAFYMSEKVPTEVFGEDNMHYFNEALDECAPECFGLLQMVLGLHGELGKTSYSWPMPNGYKVYTPVLVTDKLTTVDMLGGTFRYETKNIAEDESYKGLLANIAHSVDAFVSDEVGDRVMYDEDIIRNGIAVLDKALGKSQIAPDTTTAPSIRWVNDMGMGRYTTIAQVRKQFSLAELQALRLLAKDVLKWEAVPTFARHDEFCTYPCGMNAVRYQYQTVMAQIAKSSLLDVILSNICDEEVIVDKADISQEVLQSNYGLN